MVIPYVITIYPSLLDRLSDSACRWVFAHECAHIASKLRSGSIVIGGKPYTRLCGDEYVEAPLETFRKMPQIESLWSGDLTAHCKISWKRTAGVRRGRDRCEVRGCHRMVWIAPGVLRSDQRIGATRKCASAQW